MRTETSYLLLQWFHLVSENQQHSEAFGCEQRIVLVLADAVVSLRESRLDTRPNFATAHFFPSASLHTLVAYIAAPGGRQFVDDSFERPVAELALQIHGRDDPLEAPHLAQVQLLVLVDENQAFLVAELWHIPEGASDLLEFVALGSNTDLEQFEIRF